MSILDRELAGGLHNSRTGHGSRTGGSTRLARGSSGDLPSRASSSASLALGSMAGSSNGNLLGGEQALGHSSDENLPEGSGAASAAVTDPFAASAGVPFLHDGNAQPAGSHPGATGRSAASGMQADAKGESGAAAGAESGAAPALPHPSDGATPPRTASASTPQADLEGSQRQLSRCLSDDSDVEEDRQRLRAAQRQAAGASRALRQSADPQAAGATGSVASNPRTPDGDKPSFSSSTPDSAGASASGGQTSAAGAAQVRQRDGGHFEVAALLSGDAEPQQHPLQQAFRAAQAQLQKPQRVRLSAVVVTAEQSCLTVCAE